MKSIVDYVASPHEQELVTKEFKIHSLVLDFSQRHPDYLTKIPSKSGVYFIGGRRNDDLLKVYIGRSANIQRRITDYHLAFQVHCPNDRKLAFFQEWLSRTDPGWDLVLYTLFTDREQLATVENNWIKEFDPLVNARVQATETDRHSVHEALSNYFESFFEVRMHRNC